ncbi:hypothetical protein MO867_11375 [Microbulbifer sp. OS29]|uniref:Uncharacterized protein n=1 Tax=Microbulbifer okhotskensis TaxID=2926617 RepID=A0A9X2EMF4_9GAMM|nr:hypothetical protein [Microbulbifer okhotskensis]MCO1334939.1 hypothetical protein [Microbulbifer okhotskensis]
MKELDQLIVVLECCIILAGFAAIVGTLQPKKGRNVTKGRIVSLAMIIYISLVNALLASFTLALSNFDISDNSLWAASSAAMSLATTFSIIYLWVKKRLKSISIVAKIIYFILFGLAGSVVFMNILNTLGIIFNREYAPYFLSFVCNLFVVGYAFSRLLMRPLWEVVKENELRHPHRNPVRTG